LPFSCPRFLSDKGKRPEGLSPPALLLGGDAGVAFQPGDGCGLGHAVLVGIETTNDKMLALEKFHFDVLFSGDDWKGSERYRKTEEQFAKLGASIEYFPYTKGISTTDIKEKIKAS
jgi:hypothetical protein